MPWVLRGLRNGVLTTRYPAQAESYDPGFHGSVRVSPVDVASVSGGELACPTHAIAVTDAEITLDRGLCVLCGRCVAARPDVFSFDSGFEVASFERDGLVTGYPNPSGDDVHAVRAELAKRVKALRRSVHIRHVDAGSDGSEEWEVAALVNPVYDIQRLGVFFTASPRHADLLLVTGCATSGMAGPLKRTWDAMPEPKIVIAAGTDAVSGGIISPGYAVSAGVGSVLPVDVWVPGSPPSPFSLLHAIASALGMLEDRAGR